MDSEVNTSCTVKVAGRRNYIGNEIFYILVWTYKNFTKSLSHKSTCCTLKITGAGNGIGKEVAVQLAKSKAILVCWDILKRDNEETVDLLKCLGAKAFAFQVDISDRAQVDFAAERVLKTIFTIEKKQF